MKTRSLIGYSSCSWMPLIVLAAVTITVLIIIVPNAGSVILQSCGGGGNPCDGGQGDPSQGPGSGINPVCSPIIIDITGSGFHLTNAQDGVQFDIADTGQPVQVAWTAKDASNAFLVLDRNGNGVIDSGKEMFGNITDQPPSSEPNGFLALAEFDKPENGGNGDGVIDYRDKIFSSLRLWVDANHDGISQPGELFKLTDKGVFSISLRYKESRRMDQFGNQFRFRSRINVANVPDNASQAGPLAYDVFLVTQ